MKTIGAAVTAALLLTGCSSDPGERPVPTDTENLRYSEVDIPDGRTIPCIIYAEGYGGGVSCDWNGKDTK